MHGKKKEIFFLMFLKWLPHFGATPFLYRLAFNLIHYFGKLQCAQP